MLLQSFLLAISVSIDSLGIGITYGLKNTKITTIAKFILFLISTFITYLSLSIGTLLTKLFPSFLTVWIGTFLLVLMGFWVIYQAIHAKEEKKETSNLSNTNEPKVYQLFIKFLGVTIQIIRDPISSDIDKSHSIDLKESLYLGIALSIDSICVGIGSSILGINSIFFALLVAIFQLLFLSFGREIGIRISSNSTIPDNVWNILSGILLICIGISRLF